MANTTVLSELRQLLRPFVREHSEKKNSVYEEDV